MMTTRRRWFVEGRVQRVWFRESTRREAERENLLYLIHFTFGH